MTERGYFPPVGTRCVDCGAEAKVWAGNDALCLACDGMETASPPPRPVVTEAPARSGQLAAAPTAPVRSGRAPRGRVSDEVRARILAEPRQLGHAAVARKYGVSDVFVLTLRRKASAAPTGPAAVRKPGPAPRLRSAASALRPAAAPAATSLPIELRPPLPPGVTIAARPTAPLRISTPRDAMWQALLGMIATEALRVEMESSTAAKNLGDTLRCRAKRAKLKLRHQWHPAEKAVYLWIEREGGQ